MFFFLFKSIYEKYKITFVRNLRNGKLKQLIKMSCRLYLHTLYEFQHEI